MRRILLVEDNHDNRGLIRQAVEELDVLLVEAENGEEGLRLAQSETPDLILMDLSLPVLSGWEAIARLKADPRTAAIPIVALTAHAMAGDEARARQLGCQDYMTKPISLAPFLDMVERHLEPAPQP